MKYGKQVMMGLMVVIVAAIMTSCTPSNFDAETFVYKKAMPGQQITDCKVTNKQTDYYGGARYDGNCKVGNSVRGFISYYHENGNPRQILVYKNTSGTLGYQCMFDVSENLKVEECAHY